MINFVFVESWTCCKSQDRLKEKRHTLKSHICARWKIVTPKWLLELILQGGTSDLYILFFSLVPIIDLRDEIVEFREDCHNRNCIWPVKIKSLEGLNDHTTPAKLLIEELLFQSQ